MPRYIDADALYKETEKKIKEANSYRMAVVDSEFLDLINDADEVDVVPRDKVAKIFEEIESVLFTVARPCPSADGTIIAKHSKDFHIRREDYYTIKEKYTKGGVQE